MTRTKILLGLVFLGMLTACSTSGPGSGPDSRIATVLPENRAQTVEGEWIIKTRPGKSLSEGIAASGSIRALDAESGVYLLKANLEKADEAAILTRLEKDSSVEWAEPNFRIATNNRDIPRDPFWLEHWALRNEGQDAPSGVEGLKGADIGALAAWEVSTGSRDVVVAVLDTGIDYTHPDLRQNIWVNEAEAKGVAGIDDDGNGYVDDIYGWDFCSDLRDRPHYGQLGDPDPMDDHSHGTHVAGTIGASGNNRIGVTGINWNVRLMALKFLTAEGGGTTADEYRAIRYAIRMGVDVINASYGGGGKSRLIETALREAGQSGILFVAAAGNDGTDNDQGPHYPSNYELPNVISVAATDNRDQLAGFSNFGANSVDIAAPGVGIVSTIPLSKVSAEGRDAQPYRAYSGTSMATPHVVGAAALVLAAHPELRKNPEQLKKRLMDSAHVLAQLSSKVKSGGRLDLEGAVGAKQPINPILAGQPIEESVWLQTPRYPRELLAQSWSLHKPGARALQLHVKETSIDFMDFGGIYDSRFRFVTFLPELALDEWLPVVMGDTVRIQFSNAQVQIFEFLGMREYPTPEDGIRDGARFCAKLSSGKAECDTYKKSEAFANFNSGGVTIDRIRIWGQE